MALTDNLIHVWEFEEDTGDFQDGIGGVALQRQGTEVPSVPGIINQAADFTSTQIRARALNNVGLASQDQISVSIWVNTSAIIAGNKRLWRANTGVADVIQMVIGGTNRAFIEQNNTTQFFVVTPVGDELTPLQWYHLVYTFERNVAAIIYRDASNRIQVVPPDESTHPMGSPEWMVGANQADAERSMALTDQLAIWNRALTPAEVSGLWNNGDGVSLTGSGGGSLRRRRFSNGFYRSGS